MPIVAVVIIIAPATYEVVEATNDAAVNVPTPVMFVTPVMSPPPPATVMPVAVTTPPA